MPVRLLVAAIVLLVALLVLFLFLLATDTALSVWSQLRVAPLWLQAIYGLILVLATAAVVMFGWRWLRPGRKPAKKGREARMDPANLSTEGMESDLLASAREGVDVSAALDELQEYRRRAQGGELHIAVYGEVSSGKSSLVRAILPDAGVLTDPRAGTTKSIAHYSWSAPGGDRIIIADLPGFNLEDDQDAIAECRRAHLVIFLCDSDLTASQMRQLQFLRELGKPTILALNKLDRYSAQDQALLMERLRQRSNLAKADVVAISAGGRRQVVELLGADVEKSVEREAAPEIAPLLHAVQRHLDQDRELMETLQNTAVLLLANEKLQLARDRHRDEQAASMVSRYARRAVLGAMAAVAPGTDLIIQGVLGTQLIRELSKIYDVPIKDMEIESFLKLAGGRLRNMTALTLAIAGNALKAFPGLGTLTGGIVHAVAYGMIFDSLGRAACATLASRGALRPEPAAKAFEELLHERLEKGAFRFARMAMDQERSNDRS